MLPYTITKTQRGSWLFSWSGESSDDTFEVWLEGSLLAETSDEEYECVLPDYDATPPPLEILAAGVDAQNKTYPPLLTIQWRRVATAAYYQIEEYVDSAWVMRVRMTENGSEYYAYKTPVLDDCTTTQWRVTGLNSVGDIGTYITFSSFLVRNPPPPAVTIDYADGAVVITAEA